MKQALIAILIAISAAAAPITFQDLAAIRRVGVPRLSPDGRWVAYDLSVIDLPANKRSSAVYLIPAAGGTPKKITDGMAQDEEPVWSPDGKTIAYVSNREGGPKQIYLYDVASETSKKLSSLLAGAANLVWAPDGSGLVFTSDIYPDCGVDVDCAEAAEKTAESSLVKARVIDSLLFRHWNAWQAATRSHILFHPLQGEPRDLTPGKFDVPPFSVGGGIDFGISPDSRELAYTSNTDPDSALSTNSDIFLVPLEGGKSRRITTRAGADSLPAYSPDGRWIAYRSQQRAGYESDLWELRLYDRQTGVDRRVAPEFPHGVDSLTWTPDGRAVVVTAEENSRHAIFQIRVADGSWGRLHSQGSSGGIQLSRDGGRMFFQRSSLSRPPEIYSMSHRGEIANQLTHENDVLFSRLDLGQVSDFWTKGAEAALVQSLMVKPPGFDGSRRYPLLVLIHGGPQGAWSDSWSYRWNAQMFAARGYVVLMPNPRGSTGYGQSFVEEISRDWAGKVYEDFMNAVDVVVAMPFVDGSRTGAAGGSYGGYMINWIMGHTDRFNALLSHAGVFNLVSFYGATEELWFPEWEFGGTPWDNPEFYEKSSPHKFVKAFKTPTLVSHGELDYRVPIGEGFQLFTALQRRGVPSRLLHFPDEGHWVLKPQNSRLWYETVLEWFDRWVRLPEKNDVR